MEDKKNQPAYECKAFGEMQTALTVVQDVERGTLALRAAGKKYLPQEEAEDAGDYQVKLSRAVFFNVFRRTLQGLVGMVFRKEPKFGEDVPPAIAGSEATDEQARAEGQAENIDLSGCHWTVFAKELFEKAMRDGHAFILVDMPPALPPGSTRADEMAAGRRPYWVMREKSQAVNWRSETINGRVRLAQITFRECSLEPDGEYGEKEVVRYRVLNPGRFRIFREVKDEGGKVTYALDSEGLTSLSEIPVAVVYGHKTGFLTSAPPLLDLALLNLTHYQKYADLSTYLHIASRPILWFRGRDKSKKVESIGPYTFFDVSEQNGEVAFAETTGAALGAARQDLQDIQEWMSVFGLSLLVKSSKKQATATEEILDNVAEESPLATAAQSLKDALEAALGFHAAYLGEPSGGSVELGATVADLTLSPEKLRVLIDAAGSKISLETLWSVMQRAGELPEDFSPEEERERIEASADAMADRLLSKFNAGQ
jgi:hypothetical protein